MAIETRTEDALEDIGLFLKQMANTIGLENVKTGKQIEELSADPVFTTIPPLAFIYPASTQDVVEIVRAATKFNVSLWPYSTGKNWGYCNTAGKKNAVVVVLNRMNRIRHIDSELAYAEIEPGVTYEQLNNHLRSHNLRLWTDCTGGPPSGSVIGNALDRGVGATPYGDHNANLCGLEVVLPSGDVIRTGGFVDDKRGAWHTYKWGIGPALEGLFAQSNYGIVTRAGIWLMREPEALAVGALKIKEDNQLAGALDAVRELMFAGVLPEKARFSNDVALFTLLTQAVKEGLNPNLPLSKTQRQSLREKYSVAAWTASFGIYGLKPFVRLMRKEAARKLKPYGRLLYVTEARAKFLNAFAEWLSQFRNGVQQFIHIIVKALFGSSLASLRLLPELLDIHKGIPNESVVRRAYFRHPTRRPEQNINVARDRVGLMWFVPLVPFRGNEIAAYVQNCQTLFDEHGFNHYQTIMIMNVRTVVPLMVILYDLQDPASCQSAKALYDRLYKDARERGYQQFRCGEPGWAKIFSDLPELHSLYNALKDTLDPNHIIAPGRYGID